MSACDFDGTIYADDSTVDFFLCAMKQKPTILCYVPKQWKELYDHGQRQNH